MTITCTECKAELDQVIKIEKYNKDMERLYIKCNNCKTEYPILYRSPLMKELIEKRKKVVPYSKEYEDIKEEIEETNRLNKEIYKGGI